MNSTANVSSRHSIEVFACPSDYKPTRFFTRYCKQYVAPIYHMHLSEIARTTGEYSDDHEESTFAKLINLSTLITD